MSDVLHERAFLLDKKKTTLEKVASMSTGCKLPVRKAPIRIELMNNGFADRSLTTWVQRHGLDILS